MSLDERPVLPRYLRAREEEMFRVDSLRPYYEHAVAFCAGGPYVAIQRLSVTLARRYGPRLQRITYQSGSGSDRYYLEVRLRHVNKATGVRAVLEELGIHRRESAAIGDYTNDVEMCKFTGVSAAMKNGNDAVRAAADIVTSKSHADGGAADFFRMILRHRTAFR
jgi:phosphoserine phosphatase